MVLNNDGVMKLHECVESFRQIASPKGRSHDALFNSSFGSNVICWSFDVQQACCDNTCGLHTSGYANVIMYQLQNIPVRSYII